MTATCRICNTPLKPGARFCGHCGARVATAPSAQGQVEKEWDFFICHASEDKVDCVRPLVEALQQMGVTVWYDEFELKVGDSLLQSIDRGLSRSEFGVVVLSPNFFAKSWPKRELDGLLSKETKGQKVILPIWHRIGYDEVSRFSPILADRLASKTSGGIQKVANELFEAMVRSNFE